MGCNSPPDNRSKHQDSHQEYHHPLETCYDLVVDELKLDDQGSTLVAHPANPPTAPFTLPMEVGKYHK